MMSDLSGITNFYQLDDRIACAGQPTAAQFAAVQQAGYEVVINLAVSDTPQALVGETAVIRNLGLAYIHIPVIWTAPQPEDFEQFCRAMQAHADKKIFIHCIANMRVSAFLYLYQRTQLGLSEAAARRVMDAIWTPNPVWRQFIDRILA